MSDIFVLTTIPQTFTFPLALCKLKVIDDSGYSDLSELHNEYSLVTLTDPDGSVKVNDHFIMSIRSPDLETFIVKIFFFFLPATAIDHIPSTAAFGSAAYNGKESPKQQLVKNNLSALTRPSVLGICMDLIFNNPNIYTLWI